MNVFYNVVSYIVLTLVCTNSVTLLYAQTAPNMARRKTYGIALNGYRQNKINKRPNRRQSRRRPLSRQALRRSLMKKNEAQRQAFFAHKRATYQEILTRNYTNLALDAKRRAEQHAQQAQEARATAQRATNELELYKKRTVETDKNREQRIAQATQKAVQEERAQLQAQAQAQKAALEAQRHALLQQVSQAQEQIARDQVTNQQLVHALQTKIQLEQGRVSSLETQLKRTPVEAQEVQELKVQQAEMLKHLDALQAKLIYGQEQNRILSQENARLSQIKTEELQLVQQEFKQAQELIAQFQKEKTASNTSSLKPSQTAEQDFEQARLAAQQAVQDAQTAPEKAYTAQQKIYELQALSTDKINQLTSLEEKQREQVTTLQEQLDALALANNTVEELQESPIIQVELTKTDPVQTQSDSSVISDSIVMNEQPALDKQIPQTVSNTDSNGSGTTEIKPTYISAGAAPQVSEDQLPLAHLMAQQAAQEAHQNPSKIPNAQQKVDAYQETLSKALKNTLERKEANAAHFKAQQERLEKQQQELHTLQSRFDTMVNNIPKEELSPEEIKQLNSTKLEIDKDKKILNQAITLMLEDKSENDTYFVKQEKALALQQEEVDELQSQVALLAKKIQQTLPASASAEQPSRYQPVGNYFASNAFDTWLSNSTNNQIIAEAQNLNKSLEQSANRFNVANRVEARAQRVMPIIENIKNKDQTYAQKALLFLDTLFEPFKNIPEEVYENDPKLKNFKSLKQKIAATKKAV
ncbi:hypothetical protein H0X48_05810 [Candidatus Dependentiae bacterium]|nr:hypothetical protein [Candidatus Dependentiae bacterium]